MGEALPLDGVGLRSHPARCRWQAPQRWTHKPGAGRFSTLPDLPLGYPNLETEFQTRDFYPYGLGRRNRPTVVSHLILSKFPDRLDSKPVIGLFFTGLMGGVAPHKPRIRGARGSLLQEYSIFCLSSWVKSS